MREQSLEQEHGPTQQLEPLGDLRAVLAVHGLEQPHLGLSPLLQPHFSSAQLLS